MYYLILDLPFLRHTYPLVISKKGVGTFGGFEIAVPRRREDYKNCFTKWNAGEFRKFTINWGALEALIPNARMQWEEIDEKALSRAIYDLALPQFGRGRWITTPEDRELILEILRKAERPKYISINCPAGAEELKRYASAWSILNNTHGGWLEFEEAKVLRGASAHEKIASLWPNYAILTFERYSHMPDATGSSIPDFLDRFLANDISADWPISNSARDRLAATTEVHTFAQKYGLDPDVAAAPIA